jgi:ubiquinone/menaquinone biosynthesis C-methylase UbiE
MTTTKLLLLRSSSIMIHSTFTTTATKKAAIIIAMTRHWSNSSTINSVRCCGQSTLLRPRLSQFAVSLTRAVTPQRMAFSSQSNKAQLDQKWTEGVPDYMKEIYTWAYVNPTNVRLLDHQYVVDTLLFFNARVLERSVLDHIQPGQHVLQVGHTHGDLCPHVAKKVGDKGQFSVVDVTPVQVMHAEQKLQSMHWTTVRLGDAGVPENILPPGEVPYDVTYAFMLLHEIPDDLKFKVVANMLRSVKKGGTVVWVEYHGPPYWYNPTRYFMPFIFRWLEPFALRMWEREIESFADSELKKKFKWTKEVFGGNLYQVVIAKNMQ